MQTILNNPDLADLFSKIVHHHCCS